MTTREVRARSVLTAERKAKAAELRKQGFNFSEIAEIIGVPKSTVHNWLIPIARAAGVEPDNVVLRTQNTRLRNQLDAAKLEIKALREKLGAQS